MVTAPQLVYKILLVAGGENSHSVLAKTLAAALERGGRFQVSLISLTANGVPALANLPQSDFHAVLLFVNAPSASLSQEQVAGLVQYVENGGGLVALADTAVSFRENDALTALLGATVEDQTPGAFDYQVRPSTASLSTSLPIVIRTDPFVIRDKRLRVIAPEGAEVFCSGHIGGRDTPLGYIRQIGAGAVVYFACGGTTPAIHSVYLQRLVKRALRVAAGEKFDTTISAGIIGYGGAFNMGKVHADYINAQSGMQTVAVCDIDPTRTEQARHELGDHIRTYQNSDDFLADEGVDLVVLILPHNLHAEACIAASRAGKHVVTEKPFSITLEEADRMIAAADESGTMLSCFHNRRWDGDFQQILTSVRNGEVGEVFHIDAASGNYGMPPAWWRANKEVSGGVLYDWGAHYVDWLLNLIPQRIVSVSGALQKRYWHQSTNEDFALVNIRFVDGATATLEQGDLVAVPRAGWRILGTLGGLTNQHAGGQVTLVQHIDGLRRETVLQQRDSNWPAYYQNIANHLIMGEGLVVTPHQSRRVIGILELAEKSHAQGGVPLALPGEDSYEPDYLFPL